MGAKVEEDGESEEDEEEVMSRERLSQDMSVDREWGGRGCSRVGDSLELDDGADLRDSLRSGTNMVIMDQVGQVWTKEGRIRKKLDRKRKGTGRSRKRRRERRRREKRGRD